MRVPNLDQINKLENDALITPVTAAKLLGMTAQGVRRRLLHGKIPHVNIGGKLYLTGKALKESIIFVDPL